QPADDYVSDFVAGISRLKVVRAHAVMQPLKAFESANGKLPAEAAEFKESASLSVLIEHAIQFEQPIVIVNEAGKRKGIITRSDLLRTVVEGTETS
ncbi:MAG: glycine/betaine ABC transporter, partial [Pseudomonadota bacterium]